MSIISADVSENKRVGALPVELKDEMLCEIVDWLHNLSNAFEEQSRKIEKVTGLNRNQALIIKMVSNSPSISASELAKQMQVSSVTMVRILDRMEKQELIIRTRSSRDRRVVEIRITDKANDIDLMLGNISHDILKSCLRTTDDELMEKLKPLQKLSTLLNSASHDSSHVLITDATEGKV